ncbi:hypothetical protein ACTXM3_09270 [Glutamicibacter arilaitensis]|uniref:hypothetical protein n=1 Tax=Glutamicibacter arilaitensis TaxID=256701 RepID=UPI003FD479AA
MAKKKQRKITEGSFSRVEQTTHEMTADVGGMEIIRKKRTKWFRRYVWSAVIMTPILLAVLLLYVFNSIAYEPEAPVVESVVDSPTKATASNKIVDWLGSTPAPLPDGKLVSWDGVIDSVLPKLVEDQSGEMIEVPGLQTHKFTLRTNAGQLFESTVQVTWTDSLGATVVGEPSLQPLMRDNISTTVDTVEVWPGRPLTPAPTGVAPAVDVWLQAYVSGSSDKIRLAMKDPNELHNYFPMTQVADASVEAVTHFAVNPEDSTQGLARVTIKIIWDGTPVDTTNQEFINSGAPQTFDVLLQDVDTASPTVVAWGGAGTGQDLKPYKNAFEGRTADVANAPFFTPESVEKRMKDNIDAFNKANGGKGMAVAPNKKGE